MVIEEVGWGRRGEGGRWGGWKKKKAKRTFLGVEGRETAKEPRGVGSKGKQEGREGLFLCTRLGGRDGEVSLRKDGTERQKPEGFK